MTVALAAAAVLLGAALQSATGFGFALVSAPILFALLGPQEAVSAGALLGLELSALTLATEWRIPDVLRGEAVALSLSSLPGLALGALALRELPDRMLSVLVALAVIAGLCLRLRGRGRARHQPDDGPAPPAGAFGLARPWRTLAAGMTSGVLSTSTSLSGPPLVLHLLGRDIPPRQLRDTLAAVFLALAALTCAALVITATFVVPSDLVVMLVAGLAGQVAGRRAFAWLGGDRHEDAVLAVLAVTAVVALVSSVL